MDMLKFGQYIFDMDKKYTQLFLNILDGKIVMRAIAQNLESAARATLKVEGMFEMDVLVDREVDDTGTFHIKEWIITPKGEGSLSATGPWETTKVKWFDYEGVGIYKVMDAHGVVASVTPEGVTEHLTDNEFDSRTNFKENINRMVALGNKIREMLTTNGWSRGDAESFLNTAREVPMHEDLELELEIPDIHGLNEAVEEYINCVYVLLNVLPDGDGGQGH